MKKVLLAAFVAINATSFVTALADDCNVTCTPDTTTCDFTTRAVTANSDEENAQIDQLVDKLFRSMNICEQISAGVQASLAPYMRMENATPAQENVITRYISQTNDYMQSDKFLNAIKSTYKKYFTACEIQDLVNFYESETGKKFIAVAPQTMNDMFANITPDLQEILNQLQADLQALN